MHWFEIKKVNLLTLERVLLGDEPCSLFWWESCNKGLFPGFSHQAHPLEGLLQMSV